MSKKRIVRGDSVLLPDGTIHEITHIQYVHNRYQLLGVSGWQYGIDSLVLRVPRDAYLCWKERADKAERKEQKLKEAMEHCIKEYPLWDSKKIAGKMMVDYMNNVLSILYPKEEEA